MPNHVMHHLPACPRCGGNHESVSFELLCFPIDDDAGYPPWTHWAPCPANGQPLLLKVFADDAWRDGVDDNDDDDPADGWKDGTDP